MTLGPGTRLGPYEILVPLGAGGMGEVYKARDTRLGREVAVKVLSGHLASSLEARQRFEREAKTISTLSHPHICALFDVGNQGGVEYLVMELLEGETLAARLVRGPLPLEQTTAWGIEIAEALEVAHRQGIVHRDLKPGNVMLTRAGVKLLDFGLARAITPTPSAVDRTDSPTIGKGTDITQEGVIVGTLQYMAPEQLEARPTDSRTDIFALGTVLYEMATGRKAFSGGSRASLISSIMTAQPPAISELQPMTPPSLDRIVRTCLIKAPEDRWQSARDVALQLEAISDRAGEAEPAAAGGRRRRFRQWAPWAVSVALAAVAAAALWKVSVRPVPRPGPVRFSMPPPDKAFFYMPAEGVQIAVSPDGTQIAFVAEEASGRRVFLRRLSDPDPRPIAGTDGATSLFFSRDGRSIGFFAQDKLKRVDLSGGAPVSICDVTEGIGRAGTWGADGRILFVSVQGNAIYRVAADGGGRPEPIVRADPEHGIVRVVWPWFLPDGRRFLYVQIRNIGERTLMLAEPGRPSRAIAPISFRAEYLSSGYLVYARDGVLLAQRFDLAATRVEGGPFPIASAVSGFLSTGWAGFGCSAAGTIVYQSHEGVRRLVWFDRTGRRIGEVGTPGQYLGLAISPDGKRVAFARALHGIGTFDVWTLDLARGTETPVTSEPATSEFGPVWLPDGRSLLYSTTRATGSPQLVWRDLATGRETTVLPSAGFQEALDVTRDGRILAFAERRAGGGGFELFTLPLSGDRKPAKFPYPAVESESLAFSPNGRAVAFISQESGRSEAYVAPWTSPGERIRIAPDGAATLRWSRDGREIFYVTPDGRFVSVALRTEPALEVGLETTLFKSVEAGRPGGPSHGWRGFDVSADGRRFLAIVPEVVAEEQPLTVVTNWAPDAKP